MKNILGNINGELKIVEDSELRAVVHGNVIVQEGVNLEIFGFVHGNVIVHYGATCSVRGFVNGDILNSGKVIVEGILAGKIIQKRLAADKTGDKSP